MNYFALFHIAAALIYIMLGIYILSRDRYSGLNIVYSLLCALFALWATAFAFMHVSADLSEAYVLYNLSAPGWCLFSGFSLHVMLFIAGKKALLRKWWLYALMYFPGSFFTVMQWAGIFNAFRLVRMGPGLLEVPDPHSAWYWLYVAYQVIFIAYGLYMLVCWGLRTPYRREKKQAAVLLTSIAVTYVLSFTTDIFLPLLGVYATPSLSVFFILILAMGTLIAIVRYQMLSLSLAYASDEILKRIRDIVVLLDRSGEVLKANAWAGISLRYQESEIIGRPLCDVIEDRGLFNEHFSRMIAGSESEFSIESSFITGDGHRIPCGIGSTAIHDRVGDIIAVLVIATDLTGKRKLQREIDEHVRTANALRVSEEHLRARNEEIERQLVNAQLVQRALLPDEAPVSERLRVDYRSFMMEAVGGDYFSFIRAVNGLGVLIGDVSGHGVSAALFLTLIKSESDRIARENSALPVRFIGALNLALLMAMPQHYLTAAYGFFSWNDRDAGVILTLSKGGHPGPVLQRKGDVPAVYLEGGGPVLAQFRHAVYNEKSMHLEQGDRVFFYTDGLPETRNAAGDLYGYDNLQALIERSRAYDLSGALDFIIREISGFRGNSHIDDDMLIIGCEVL